MDREPFYSVEVSAALEQGEVHRSADGASQQKHSRPDNVHFQVSHIERDSSDSRKAIFIVT